MRTDLSVSVGPGTEDQFKDRITERLHQMTEHGIERTVLVAYKRGATTHPGSVDIPAAWVRWAVENGAGRILGAAGADPSDAVHVKRWMGSMIGDGFAAVHIAPHCYGEPPDDGVWFPLYAECESLGIPVQIELGVTRSPGARMLSVGRPLAVDSVASHFPDLKVVCVGAWPWVDEAISMSYKHDNVFLAVGDHDPVWPHYSLTRYADSWGRGKVGFASGFSPLEDAVDRVRTLGLREESFVSCFEGVAGQVLS